MTVWKKYAVVALVAFLAGMSAMYYATHREVSKPIPTQDRMISRVTVTIFVPLQGLDKTEARESGLIAGDVLKDADSAVLATGTVKDDSGTSTVAAVVNVKDGITQLVEKRPIAEIMSRYELGIGYGLESGDLAKALQGCVTIGRIGNVYFTGQAQYLDVDREDNRHPWNALAFVNVRF